MTNKQDFDSEHFEDRLEILKDTQDGIQQMSSWCLQQRSHHKKIVASWLNVFKKVRVEHRLILFYLANDVIQYSKRKRYEFVESWATALQRATTMVRDDKVRNKIFRIFKIWEQRGIYSEEYLSDLSGLLSMNISKKSSTNPEPVSDEFQSSTLISNIRECVELSATTDKSFKNLPKAPNCDIENIKAALKDKSHSDDVERELERYETSLEKQRKHLAAEIKSRKALLTNLETAITFYASQRGEVKVVVSAYKNFGSRIKLVKKKLDEITPTLASPIPSPDINAPSPEPDSDINLPDEQSSSMNIFKSAFNGYTSYLDGKLPFDINDFKRGDSPKANTSVTASQPIEVIASRSDSSDALNDSFSGPGFYKPEPLNPMASINPYSASAITLPVPSGQSEYSSLARPASSNYTSPSLSYAPSHTTNRYNPMVPNYASDPNYISNQSNNSYDASMPLMPPPLPPSISGGPSSSQSEDFNSTWDLDMSWTPLDTSSQFNHCIDTPISPGNFDQDNLLEDSAAEYDELENDIMPMQDVDHRQLHLPVPIAPSMPLLGQSKSRPLDIDHRNLIALTGSPSFRSTDEKYKGKNKTWVAPSKDKDFRIPMTLNPPAKPTQEQFPPTSSSGDVDYRVLPMISTTTTTNITPTSQAPVATPATPAPPVPPLQPPPMLTGLLNFPQVIMASESETDKTDDTQSDKNDKNQNKTSDLDGEMKIDETGGYDPSDMVESIDMDMSDEDLEDILREVASEDRQKAIKDQELLEENEKQKKIQLAANEEKQPNHENEHDQLKEQNSEEQQSSEEYDAISNNDEYIPEEPTEEPDDEPPVKSFSYRDNLIPVANNRPPLLDTPPPSNNKMWDNQPSPATMHVNPFSQSFENQLAVDNGMHNNIMRPPLNPWKQQPRMNFHMQQNQDGFQQGFHSPGELYQPGDFQQPGDFHQPGDFQHRQPFQRFPRGPFQQSPRNFNNFRGSPRPLRGNPFFTPRGGGGGPGGRGNGFRGKFRGNAWH